MKKRILSLILTLVMLSGIIGGFPAVTHAAMNIEIGEYVQMGTYYGEPILWRCVAFEKIKGYDDNGNPIIDSMDTVTEYKDGYLPLMLSDKIISIKPYDAIGDNMSGSHGRGSRASGSNYWADSNMRSWLNSEAGAGNVNWLCGNSPVERLKWDGYRWHGLNEYADEAGFLSNFTQSEKNAIKTVTQKSLLYVYEDGSYHSNYHIYGHSISGVVENYDSAYCEYVTDRMFLLDVKQVNEVYNNRGILGSSYYIGQPTAKAVENSESEMLSSFATEKNWYYWLRSPCAGYRSGSVRYVASDGYVFDYDTYSSYIGVRPAFYLDLPSFSVESGGGTKLSPYTIGDGSSGRFISTVPKMDFPESISITLGNLPQPLYVYGIDDVRFISDNNNIISLQPTSLTQLGAKQAVSAVWVTGKTPGTATITATAPDGRTAQCVVTVNGQIAETISDEMILKAKICASNGEYRYIADRFTPPNVILLQNIDDGTLTAANYYHGATEAVEALNLDFKLDDFYEIALLSMISTNDSWVDSVNTVLSDSTLNFAVKEINNIIKSSPTKEALDKQLSEVFDYSTWTQIDVISKGINAGQNMDKFVSDMYALKYTSNEFRLMLELIKDNTEIQELKNACTNLLGDIEEAEQKSEARIVGESVEVGAVSVAKSFAEDIWDVFVDRVPAASMIKKSLEGGLALSELICSADELSNGMLKMCAFAVIENEMKDILQEQENAFTERQSAKNAERFIAAANIYKSLMIASCDSAIEYVQSVENAERKNQVVSAAFMGGIRAAFDNDLTWNEVVDIFWSALGGLSVDGKYETMKNSIAHIKQMTEEYNFYDICGDDVANYIRNVVSTTPSTWAEPYIDKAVSHDLLPEEYQNNYQNNITRAEFCTLLTYLIESKSGESVDAIADRMGRPQITVQFDDTMYPYVDYIARIGIINGTGNNKFEPLGEITREQAAKMLCETAKALGYDTAAPQTNLSGVSDWAKEGVNFVVDRGIMTGTDNGFEPQGKYTKEQAITTMVRFHEKVSSILSVE